MTTIRPILLLSALLSLGAAGDAAAHAHLTSSVPAGGATVPAVPRTLQLTFTEGLNLRFTGVTVTGPDRAAVATGDPRFGPAGDATIVVPLVKASGPGRYAVTWHALARDGHKTEGSYTFTVAP